MNIIKHKGRISEDSVAVKHFSEYSKEEHESSEPESRLKPCPFCGGTDLTLEGLGYTRIDMPYFQPYRIYCKDCYFNFDLPDCDIGQAISAWNKRPDKASS